MVVTHGKERMTDTRDSPVTYSLQVLLPDALNRSISTWAAKMPGASWPEAGGHVTLAPRFYASCTTAELEARLAAVCAKVAPFDLRLGSPAVVPDLTRPAYHAVFLTPGADTDVGIAEILSLRSAIDRALEPVRTWLHPELDRQPFLPHLTLALGVAQSEAHKLFQSLRVEPLVAEWSVDAIWLQIYRDDAKALDQRRLALGSARKDAKE
jgi:2'-5' RNA ligase